jgi:hypothetical protein
LTSFPGQKLNICRKKVDFFPGQKLILSTILKEGQTVLDLIGRIINIDKTNQ